MVSVSTHMDRFTVYTLDRDLAVNCPDSIKTVEVR